MKNQFIVTLLIFCMSTTVAMAQTKKPTTTTKKPTTTVKSSVPKTTTTTKKTTTTTTTTPVVTPPVVEQKTTTTTTTTTTTPTQGTTTPATTTTIQSSGPSKGKKTSEPKPEKVREPKPEKVRTPRESNGSSGGIKFGIRAEASQLVTFEEGVSFLVSPGFNAGLIVNIPISEKLAIQPEVLYSMQNAKIDGVPLGGASGDYIKKTSSSILTPVTLNINLGQNSTKFMINLGGYADYALSSESQVSDGGVVTSMSADLDKTDRFSYGAVVGLGVKLNNSFLIEARSFYDLKTSNNKTIGVTLGIGYLF